jgi:hypothetical protein
MDLTIQTLVKFEATSERIDQIRSSLSDLQRSFGAYLDASRGLVEKEDVAAALLACFLRVSA